MNFFLKQTKTSQNILSDYTHLPIQADYFDCFISFMDLHWVNDVPGFLKQAYTGLKEDSLFLAVFFWRPDIN